MTHDMSWYYTPGKSPQTLIVSLCIKRTGTPPFSCLRRASVGLRGVAARRVRELELRKRMLGAEEAVLDALVALTAPCVPLLAEYCIAAA